MTKRQIFAYGGQVVREFVQYTVKLTGKSRPRVGFLPTATGDNESYIEYFYQLCEGLSIEPHVQRVWISSYSQSASFEDILVGMDAIIVGGGNTLNMMALWKAQEIDKALFK
ncbi:MAG: Type 1 glutamine amidotransferase-like domain-containing protein, partial [Bacteroidota bacterium]